MDPWARSRGALGSSPPEPGNGSPDRQAPSLKAAHRFVPPSWKDFLLGWRRRPRVEIPLSTYAPENLHISAPASPLLERPKRTLSEGRGSVSEDKEGGRRQGDEKDPLAGPVPRLPAAPSQGGWSTPPPGYQERLAAFESKYGFLKSWPGLLRLMGALELILGGMAFACTVAYIQKDYQWSQLYGGGQWPYGGPTADGYTYYGPMTPFVLVVASLAWLVTVILLGLGVTVSYRSILLRAHWWPLTEFGLNLVLSLLYLAASLAYVHDINRGGLCYSVLAANPLVVALCRVGGGQVAALTFLFLTTFLYLAGALVCLRMWKHEGARRAPVFLAVPSGQPKPVLLRAAPEPTAAPPPSKKASSRRVAFSEKSQDPEVLNYAIPTGYNPRSHVLPDYILKYPAIRSAGEREKYKAVFNDQYSEYKELQRDLQAALQKFQDLEAALAKLPRRQDFPRQEDQGRVSAVRKEYERKRRDPTFLEKRERCEYLKGKLGHLKGQIQAYDWEKVCQGDSSVYF